ncbi:MAG: hypothetical protein CL608_02260, partial [Anaerolineaceae bacterium]|nr:hypothetical protein [Anaerolineaceae bacterium]
RFALPQHKATSALAHYGWDEAEASALMRQLGRLTDEESSFLIGLTPPEAAASPDLAALAVF